MKQASSHGIGDGTLLSDRRAGRTGVAAKSDLQRDGRHFLKRLANVLGWRPNTYSIVARPAGVTDDAEVVLRSGGLIAILGEASRGPVLTYGSYSGGESLEQAAVRQVALTQLRTPARQQELLVELRSLAARHRRVAEQPAD